MQNPSIPDHSASPAARLAAAAAASPPDAQSASSPDLPRNDSPSSAQAASPADLATRPREIGGRDGPEPTRFGDWEKAGRCIDF
jgi:hypothetical protein